MNLTPGKVACILLIERAQIDASKVERTQIHFFHRRVHCRRRRPCLRSLLASPVCTSWIPVIKIFWIRPRNQA